MTKQVCITIPVALAKDLKEIKPLVSTSRVCQVALEQVVKDLKQAPSREKKLVIALKAWGYEISN